MSGRGPLRRLPLRAAALVLCYAAVLVFGAVTHAADLITRWPRPYSQVPAWIDGYWASLALWDVLAAALLLRGRRAGLDLACLIMVSDAAANWYASDDLGGRLRLTAFAVLLLASAPWLRPLLRAGHPRSRSRSPRTAP